MQNTKQLQTAATSKGSDANQIRLVCPKSHLSPLPSPLATFCIHASPAFWSNSKTAIKSVYLILQIRGHSSIMCINFWVSNLRSFAIHWHSENAQKKVLFPMSDNPPLSLLASLHTIPAKTQAWYYFALNSTSFPNTTPTFMSMPSLPSTPPHTLIKGKK